jgi:hypothetical protein
MVKVIMNWACNRHGMLSEYDILIGRIKKKRENLKNLGVEKRIILKLI